MNFKLARMVLFLTYNTELNRTALNKLLFFSDVAYCLSNYKKIISIENYSEEDYIISRDRYFKKRYGPVPESIEDVRNYLIANKFLIEKTYSTGYVYQYGYLTSEKIIEKKLNDSFEEKELECLINVRKNLSIKPSGYLSEMSHEFEPWKSAKNWNEELKFDKVRCDTDLINWLKEMNVLNNDFE